MENMILASIWFQPRYQYKECHTPQFVYNQNMNKKKNAFTQMHIWIHIKHDIRGLDKGLNRLSNLKFKIECLWKLSHQPSIAQKNQLAKNKECVHKCTLN
jgi:hypothetical protein